MIFKFMSLVMAGIVALFVFTVDPDHVMAAAAIPAAAAIGLLLLGTT